MTQTSSRQSRGAPAATTATRGIILVVCAVVVGAMLLWKGGGSATDSVPGEQILKNESTLPGGGSAATPTDPAAPPSTSVPQATLLVVVANGSGVKGAAGVKKTELISKGYSAAQAGDANEKSPLTSVFPVPGAEGDAAAVAAALGLPATAVAAMPTKFPSKAVTGVNQADIKVIVLLGEDSKSAAPTGQ